MPFYDECPDCGSKNVREYRDPKDPDMVVEDCGNCGVRFSAEYEPLEDD